MQKNVPRIIDNKKMKTLEAKKNQMKQSRPDIQIKKITPKKIKKKINPKHIRIIKMFLLLIISFMIYFIEYIYLFKIFKEDKEIIIDINELFENNTLLANIKDDVTIVTGYFRIKSKYKASKYSKWLNNFLKINHPMIFFVDNVYYPEIIAKRPKKYRNITIWVKTSIKDFLSYKYYFNEFNQTFYIDIENFRHTVPLYLIWAEKVNFLKIAITKNYFQSKCFYWVDAGSFRKKRKVKKFINDWPSPKKCFEDGRVVINEIIHYPQEFRDKILKFDVEAHNQLQSTYNVDGSVFGGEKDYILKFNALYYDALNKFLEHGIFIGKDQNIFAYIAYSNEDIVKLVFLKRFNSIQKYIHKDYK